MTGTSLTKISIKLKQTNEYPPLNNIQKSTKLKISLKKDSHISLSDVQKTKVKERVKVSYIFLEEGQFLFDKQTCCLYTVQTPYKKIGIISLDGKPLFSNTP